MKKKLFSTALISILAIALLATQRQNLHTYLFHITGEEETLKQVSGGVQYLLTKLHPPLKTADDVPVNYADVSPFGVNTFLQNEAEPHKRELAMQMVASAGFKWIRQEFPWEDIEIHGKGDFEDRRNAEHIHSAWDKYDQIVDLAEENGIQIMARLSNPPAWTRAQGNDVGSYAPPDNIADYGDYVEAVATRYKGCIHVYQIWNEPNIYPEWGQYPINAEEYVALLKEGYTRIKAVDPDAIVVMGALAATIEVDRQRKEGISPGGLTDALFLQQVYDAGGGDYFDVLAMQGYGLWSGPYDRRMQPRVLNFSRPLYIRDIMVRNGDADKAIWLSEMAWNAVPPESGIPPIYGQVSAQKQAEYAVLAYQRIQEEMPWIGVGFYWFLKQATDQELKDGNPQYFFRLLDPDFTPQPVYDALKTSNAQTPVMYAGWHQENHWALQYSAGWQSQKDDVAVFGKVMQTSQSGETIGFDFSGKRLTLIVSLKSTGELSIRIDGETKNTLTLDGNHTEYPLFKSWRNEKHRIEIITLSDETIGVDGFSVKN